MSDLRFYHGTRRGFSRGGYVTPRTFHQNSERTSAPVCKEPRADADAHTYLTTSLVLAWVYAWSAPGRGKPKVLTVEPLGTVTRDPEHSLAMQAYRCNGWLRVVGMDVEPVITEAQAREGWYTP